MKFLENDKLFTIEAQVPGLTKDNLNLSVRDDTITLDGKFQENSSSEDHVSSSDTNSNWNQDVFKYHHHLMY